MFKKLIAAAVIVALTISAQAASTVNPTVPAVNAPLASAPIRANFAAANSDINNIFTKFAGSGAPYQPSTNQEWMNTTSLPWVMNIFDGSQWDVMGTLSPSGHVFTPVSGGAPGGAAGGDLGGTYPNPTVLSVAHVTTGTLTVGNGGTGATALTANSFLTGNGTNAVNAVAITGLVLGNGASAPSAYAGVTATSHEFITALSAAGVGTLAQPAVTDISGFGTGVATFLATPSSANFAAAITGETGTGALVFATAPTITLANGTGLPLTTGVTGILPGANGGTGVANTSKTLTLGANLVTTGAGASTFALGASVTTFTFPSATSTLAALAIAQSWTAAQTFNTSDLLMKGSSTGVTTFATANASTTSYTQTFPALTGGVIVTGTATPAQGDILYYSGTNWIDLAPGTSGFVLSTGGSAANPSWIPTTSQTINTPLTVTDASGAGLTFAGSVGKMTTVGNIVYLHATFTIPSTANTSNIAVTFTGFPTSPATVNNTCAAMASIATSITGVIPPGSAFINFYQPSSALYLRNSDLGGGTTRIDVDCVMQKT